MRQFLSLFVVSTVATLLISFQAHSQVVLAESFEGTDFPGEWTFTSSVRNNWVIDHDPMNAFEGASSLSCKYLGGGTGWAFSPSPYFNTNPITITFYVKVNSASSPTNMKLTVGKLNTETSHTTVLLDSTTVANTSYRRWTTTYTPPSAGYYCFAFSCAIKGIKNSLYIDGLTITQEATPLPINLSEFKAFSIGYNCKLTWKTLTETNNSYFDIESSIDGTNFGKIGSITSKAPGGNSSAVLEYNYDAPKLLSAITYYRLRQVDMDGKFVFSPIVSIEGNTKTTSLTLVTFPNPVKNNMTAVIGSPVASKGTISITDMSGKILSRQAINFIAGRNTAYFNTENFTSGIYTLKVDIDNIKSIFYKFTK